MSKDKRCQKKETQKMFHHVVNKEENLSDGLKSKAELSFPSYTFRVTLSESHFPSHTFRVTLSESHFPSYTFQLALSDSHFLRKRPYANVTIYVTIYATI